MIKKIKIILITFAAIFISCYAHAEKKTIITADPFPLERPGQYVYYHDMRTGIYGSKEPLNRLLGIMKADNKQYIIRVCSLKDGKSFLFLGRFILNNGSMEFFTESIQGDSKAGTLVMAELMNLMTYLGGETIKYSQKIQNKNDLIVNSEWKSYNRKLVNSYKWWVPFYKLVSSSNFQNDSYGEKDFTSLKLICFGTVASNDPDMFTRISKLPVYYKNKINDKKYLIPEAAKRTVKLDNVSLKLDTNWYFEKGDPAGSFTDTYWLKKITARDAQIGVESIALNNLKLENNIIESFVKSLQFQSCVIADTVSIDVKGKMLSLSLWDADSGTATFTKYISLGAKKNILTMVNFSALDFIYYGNTEYFDSILNADFNN